MASEGKAAEKKPRIVFAEFDGWIQETNALFDTTHESMAKEGKIFDEKAVYEPLPLLLGRDRLFPGLEESMLSADIGKDYEIVIPQEKAAGPRDPKLVGLFPLRDFLKQEIMPELGLQVTIKNKTGYISAVTAGRVRVDFNNKLAGKTLKYKYKLISEPSTDEEIFNAIMKMNYGTHEGFSMEKDGKKAVVKLPDVCKYDQKWTLSKFRVVTDIREVLGVDTVQFIEEYAKAEKKEDKKEEKAEEKKEEHKCDDPECDHDHDHGHEHKHDEAKHEAHKPKAPAKKKSAKKSE